MQPLLDSRRLLERVHHLGNIGRAADRQLSRLAASSADKEARDQLGTWIRESDLRLRVDEVGNMFGIWDATDNDEKPILLIGSHIDTVVDAGILDGSYGVLAGLEVIDALRRSGFQPRRSIGVAAFSNEECVRYPSQCMGSAVFSGGGSVSEALSCVGADGTVFGEELGRIGYRGPHAVGLLKPHAYIELHIEQGPILDHEDVDIGVVENLQGVSWRKVTLHGAANHAGTTPMHMRQDAAYAAARVVTYVHDCANEPHTATIATVGTLTLEPNLITVVPSKASLIVDIRNPDIHELRREEAKLNAFTSILASELGIAIDVECVNFYEPATFDESMVKIIEVEAARCNFTSRRMTSGAGHDAQPLSTICPAAMIFVPSIGGYSHSPKEHTADRHRCF